MVDIYKNNIIYDYEKNIKNNYLIIKNVNINKDSYEYKIIEEENIENILKPKIQIENNEFYYSIDISRLYSLEQYIKYNKLKKKDIIFIIKSIDDILSNIENYLISENSVLLDIKSIFLNKNNNKVCLNFIIIPNLNIDFSFELSKLLIKLMRYIDIDDKDALQLAYELFVKSSKDNYTISDLLDITSKFNTNISNEDDIISYEFNTDENQNIIDYDKEMEILNNSEINNYYNNINNYNNSVKDINKDKLDNTEDNLNLNSIMANKQYDNTNYDNKIKKIDNYISIDNKTKNILNKNLFESIDDDISEDEEDNKYIEFKTKLKNSRKKKAMKTKKTSIDISVLVKFLIPIIAILFPVLIYVIFGKSVLLKNIYKIIFFEILIIGTYIINIVIDSINQ